MYSFRHIDLNGLTRPGFLETSNLKMLCKFHLQVFQLRYNGEVDFYRSWTEYKTGFGDLEGEYWLGNEQIHLLTKSPNQQVKYKLGTADGETAFAEYFGFRIEDESQGYRLHTGEYYGDASPGKLSILSLTCMAFSTIIKSVVSG